MYAQNYKHLGAHPEIRDGVSGTHFAVWAPNAREVSVIADLNFWSHGQNWLQSSDDGVWRGFIPGIKPGDIYKYSLKTASGLRLEKSDPMPLQPSYHHDCFCRFRSFGLSLE